jgi:hypothetical protein
VVVQLGARYTHDCFCYCRFIVFFGVGRHGLSWCIV